MATSSCKDSTIQQPQKKPHRRGRSIEECKHIFLKFYARGWSVGYAAHQAGIDRTTTYLWRKADPEFAKAWADAYESGSDVYEDKLRQAALGGNITALIVALKMRKRFVEHQELDHQGVPAGSPVQVLIQVNGQTMELGEYRRQALGLPPAQALMERRDGST